MPRDEVMARLAAGIEYAPEVRLAENARTDTPAPAAGVLPLHFAPGPSEEDSDPRDLLHKSKKHRGDGERIGDKNGMCAYARALCDVRFAYFLQICR